MVKRSLKITFRFPRDFKIFPPFFCLEKKANFLLIFLGQILKSRGKRKSYFKLLETFPSFVSAQKAKRGGRSGSGVGGVGGGGGGGGESAESGEDPTDRDL